MFYMKKPNLQIKTEEYKEALYFSLKNEEWVSQAYKDERNMLEWIDSNNTVLAKKAVDEYKKTKDIAALIRVKNQMCFSEQAMEMIFEAGKAKTNLKLAEIIFNKTDLYASITKNLLFEYCENSGVSFNGTITPFPENVQSTIRPINKFKIETEEEGSFKVELRPKNLFVYDNTTNLNNLKDYFEERCKSKNIKKRFLKAEQITSRQYSQAVRELVNLKETQIPSSLCYLTSEGCKYKILYRGNQTVSNEIVERSLLGNNLEILGIVELK